MSEKIERKAHIFQRDNLDWYVEPKFATEALLKVERFSGRIWDPACGQGNIISALLHAGYNAAGTDIVRRVPENTGWFCGEFDFLNDEILTDPDCYVFNPPFYRAKGAEAFIRRAVGSAQTKVAAFVDLKFLGSVGRANGLFNGHPPTRIWMITPRPSCPPGEFLKAGNKAGGGTADWVWLVWDLTAPYSGTSFGWLRGGK